MAEWVLMELLCSLFHNNISKVIKKLSQDKEMEWAVIIKVVRTDEAAGIKIPEHKIT